MLPTWTIVATGLTLNVIAAMSAHFIESEHTAELDTLTMQQSRNLRTIDLNWQQVQGLERKRDTLYLLLAQASQTPQTVSTAFAKQLAKQLGLADYDFISNDGGLNQIVIESAIEGGQNLSRNSINDLFIENLQLMEQAQRKVKAISQTKNLALFLQIVGLAMMLARDLRPKS
ncbi:hypothetical protein DBZ36_13560 [Alginatibacterium sediminis]|uniref:DNA mismatch repair protein n=1 Tax=Alginatibacterium sediminis TaxID=2164068 RepID=A0A420E9X5_9ALTE|nr:hypothetical protein [Alginatibacterium sediminis]RKF17470.1 hypothetical protein DBZ36_13560 [Alginatibacterium sediminis]